MTTTDPAATVTPVDGKPVEPAKPVETPKPEEPKPPVVEFKPVTLTDLKLPEGITLSEESAKEFNNLALEAKLAPEVAQKMLDQHVAVVQAASKGAVAQVTQAFIDQGNAWAKETREDKEIGGQNLPVFQQTVAKAMDMFGDPDVKKAFNETGAGNHPVINRFLFRLAKAVTEGGGTRSGQPPAQPKSAGQLFYPEMTQG